MNVIITIIMLLFIISYSISNQPTQNNSQSPFECGFNPSNTPHSPFSSQFFIIGILFLIFDVEISIIIPLILCPSSPFNQNLLMVFLCILTWGFILEWKSGTVSWNN